MFDYLAPNVLYTVAGIYGLLILSTVVVLAMAAVKQQHDFTELKRRVFSWWIIIVVFSGAMLVSHVTMLFLFAFICFWALKEFFSMIPTRQADRRVLFWAYLAIPIQFYWIYIQWFPLFLIWIPVYMFLFLPLRMVMIGETKGFLPAAATIQWGLMTTVFSISHLAYLFTFSQDANPDGGGAGLVIYLVMLTQLNDVAQYCWGKTLGKRKIIPKVSPNKTVAGFLGGVITTVSLSAAVAPFLTPMHLPMALVAGLLIAVTGFIGDIVISAVKRDIGVKDTGELLPGHGGILDRIDSLTYTAPLFFHFINYFYG